MIRAQLPHRTDAPEPAHQVAEHELESGGLSLAQLLTIARFYWKQTLAIGLVITAGTAVYAKLLPKTYTAIATLIVNPDNKDPLAGQEFPQAMLANYVATQTELIQGPVILQRVVDRLDLTHDKEFATAATSADPNAAREGAEKALARSIEVDEGKGGQLLYISASAKNPVKSAKIANAVTDVYLDEERRRTNDPAGERAQRYSAQLAELRDKVTAAQDKVTEFRQRNGISDLNAADAGVETQALTNLEQRLLDAQNQRRAIEAKQSGQEASSDEALNSLQVNQLKNQLAAEETELAQLRSTLGPRHPKVLALESQRDTTKRQFDSELQMLSANTSSELTRAQQLENKYAQAVADQRAKVLRLRQLQDAGGKLTLELDSAQAVYKRALDGYDQIMFASVGNYTNVDVISRATPPVKASKPNKIRLFIVGAVAGFVFGFVSPLLYELLYDRRLRCRDDIERDFGIPVLAQLGRAALPAGKA